MRGQLIQMHSQERKEFYNSVPPSLKNGVYLNRFQYAPDKNTYRAWHVKDGVIEHRILYLDKFKSIEDIKEHLKQIFDYDSDGEQ